MVESLRPRDCQRARTERAITDAAWDLFAASGPDGVSLRAVAERAGCSHALVARYFGSKDGLTDAVAAQVAVKIAHTIEDAWSHSDSPLAALLVAARRDPACTRLLVRSGLGDLGHTRPGVCLGVAQLHSRVVDRMSAAGATGDGRARLCAYAASSLWLGWVTFEGFLIEATGLRRTSPPGRDLAVAAAAEHVIAMAPTSTPALTRANLRTPLQRARSARSSVGSQERLLAAAVALFAQRGPASVSVRDIGRGAGVNQGLIYRHFGSKEALLAAAIEQGSSGLVPAALNSDGFDLDAVIYQLHHGSPAPRLIARTLVDDIDMAVVRTQFPVLGRLLAAYDQVPAGSGLGDLSDPRIAVATSAALALGSAIWGRQLRQALALTDRDRVEAAVSDIARELLAIPAPTHPMLVPG